MPTHLRLLSLFAVTASIGLSGCSLEEMQARREVRDGLKDPESAKFGKMIRIDKESACLTVNAKNEMGGYSGDQYAVMVKIDGKWKMYTILEYLDNCKEVLKSLKGENKDFLK